MKISNDLISKIKTVISKRSINEPVTDSRIFSKDYDLSEFTKEEAIIFDELQETIFYCFYGDEEKDWIDIISFESIDRLGLNRIGCASVTLNDVEYIIEVRDGIEDGSVIEFFEDDIKKLKDRPLIEESVSDRIANLDPMGITPDWQ